jgi:UDP-N-acetylglucosamine--N-acetylmuramyl-(pentapeptide) pyrophosphoryl-undecaprenol N-acetylglucosamine transferase
MVDVVDRTDNSRLKTQDAAAKPVEGRAECGKCVCAMGVWNGRPTWLICANFPGHEGQLTQVSGSGVVLDCRKFCLKHEMPEPEKPEGDIRTINLRNGRAVIVDAADYEWLSRYSWRATGGESGYAVATIKGKKVLMHRLILNAPPHLLVDHYNGNKQDNRRCNVRLCTRSQNSRNVRKSRGTSRFKGVWWDKRLRKWVASIRCRGKRIRLGVFTDEAEAARAYDRKAIELFGEFARLNFPQKIRLVSLSGTITGHSHLSGQLQVLKSETRNPTLFGCRVSNFVLPRLGKIGPVLIRLAVAGLLLAAGVWLGQKTCTNGGLNGYHTGRGSDKAVGTGLDLNENRVTYPTAGMGRRFLKAGRLIVSGYSFFFAGGGTGGHIYPALAVAEEIVEQVPEAEIHFLCSTRAIDQRILGKTNFKHTPLPATGLYFRPVGLARFCKTFYQSYVQAKRILGDRIRPNQGEARRVVVIGAGGFVAAPACLAGRRMGVPVALVNVDTVPGRANRLCARWADEVFMQFEDSRSAFRSVKQVHVVGCPLRKAFAKPDREAAIKQLQLDPKKKVLLITGASSGSASINEAVTRLLPKLEAFADGWQIVHLTGLDNHAAMTKAYEGVRVAHQVVNFYDRMPDLYAAADLLIGRSGAVSVAEYAMAGVPSICMPYPHHKDRHQYLNAGKLVDAGSAVIVDDVPDVEDRTEWLWEELEPLMKDDSTRREMAEASRKAARPNAAAEIARRLLVMAGRNG